MLLNTANLESQDGETPLGADSESEKLTAEVKEAAHKSGADLVGIVLAKTADELPRIWVGWTIQEFTKKASDAMPDAKSLVVIGYHVWDDMFELAVRKGEKWVYPGYFPLDYMVQKVTHHLEKKGYNARAFYESSCKRLAQLAGFGNYGKNALIINPKFGPWMRFTAVVTNAELVADKPFEKDLCGHCESCVRACPVGALTPYKVDDTRCLVGILIRGEKNSKYDKELARYEPRMSRNAHLMCVECQKACRYGAESR